MTIWVYIDTSKQVDDDHVKAFASVDEARAWFVEHDPEGVAFEHSVAGKFRDEMQKRMDTDDHFVPIPKGSPSISRWFWPQRSME